MQSWFSQKNPFSSMLMKSDQIKDQALVYMSTKKFNQKKDRVKKKLEHVQYKLKNPRKKTSQEKIMSWKKKEEALIAQLESMDRDEIIYKDFALAIDNYNAQLNSIESMDHLWLPQEDRNHTLSQIKKIRRQLLDVYGELKANIQKHETTKLLRRCDELMDFYYVNKLVPENDQQPGASEIVYDQQIKQLQSELQQQRQQSLLLQGKLNDQKKQVNDDDTQLCQICFENPKEYAAVPCGHYIYCGTCKVIKTNLCLVCRKDVQFMMKIYT